MAHTLKTEQLTSKSIFFKLTKLELENIIKLFSKSMASTQMEPADARRAFPCMDEPNFKASWQLTMIRDSRNFESSYFNSPLISTTPHSDQNWSVDKFEQSAKMSSYLVAFVVSNLKKIEKKSPKYGVTIEVVGKPESIDNGDGEFALNEAAEIIDYYSDYFNIPYPNAKSSKIFFLNKILNLFDITIS